jgi:hypothetical protein
VIRVVEADIDLCEPDLPVVLLASCTRRAREYDDYSAAVLERSAILIPLREIKREERERRRATQSRPALLTGERTGFRSVYVGPEMRSLPGTGQTKTPMILGHRSGTRRAPGGDAVAA